MHVKAFACQPEWAQVFACRGLCVSAYSGRSSLHVEVLACQPKWAVIAYGGWFWWDGSVCFVLCGLFRPLVRGKFL